MNKIICISRQYASGGHEIGELLAEKYAVPLYDKQIIAESVKASGLNTELIESHDENLKSGLLYSIAMGQLASLRPPYISPPGDKVYQAQAQVIRRFAENDPCVIIGRSAGEILRDMPDSVRIFIYANDEFRIWRAIHDYGCAEKDCGEILRQMDRQRAAHFNHYNNRRWGMIESFDLAVDSSRIGILGAVQVIDTYLRHMA